MLLKKLKNNVNLFIIDMMKYEINLLVARMFHIKMNTGYI